MMDFWQHRNLRQCYISPWSYFTKDPFLLWRRLSKFHRWGREEAPHRVDRKYLLGCSSRGWLALLPWSLRCLQRRCRHRDDSNSWAFSGTPSAPRLRSTCDFSVCSEIYIPKIACFQVLYLRSPASNRAPSDPLQGCRQRRVH